MPLTPPAFIHFITTVWEPHAVPVTLEAGTSLTIIDKARKSSVSIHLVNDSGNSLTWGGGDVTSLMYNLWRSWELSGCMEWAVGLQCGQLEGSGVKVEVRG